MKTSSMAYLVMFLSLAMAASPASAHEPPRLVEYPWNLDWTPDDLSADQTATLKSIRSDPTAVDVRIGQAYPGAVRNASALSLVVPGPQGPGTGVTISFHDLSIELRSQEDYSFFSRDETSGSEVSLVVLGQDVLGTIRYGTDIYKVHPLGEGLTAVYRYDSSQLETQSADDIGAIGEDGRHYVRSEDSDALPIPPTASENDMAAIDMLVAYTWQARIEARNVGALIRHAIEQVNQMFDNSLVRARVRLVYSYQTNYAQQDDPWTDLDHLRSIDDGYLDEVHAVRNQHGADIVVLLRGHHPWCWSAYDFYNETIAFSVVAQSCMGVYGLAKALGRNLGASRDPDSRSHRRFSYGHALCYDPGNWRTVMSTNPDSRCSVLQPYFSNPDVSFMGTPTGDAEIRNNARVINETAPIVAKYRQVPLEPHAVPLVTSADNENWRGFVRVINRSERTGTVRIHAIDDEGRRFDPIELSLDAKQTRHFNSADLEDGNPTKGLSGGVGDGTGNWRLELETELDIEVLAYIRTPDGFLTSIHQVAAHADYGSTRFHVPIFNPGTNVDQQSRLRLINLGDSVAKITIAGLDDQGNAPPEGRVRLTLLAGAAHLLTAEELEQGAEGFSGRFGAGSGKWQLFVSADQPIQIMSLLLSPTGNLTNLSP